MRFIARLKGWPIDPLPKLSKAHKLTINTAFKALLSEWKFILRDFPKANKLSNPALHLNRYKLILKDLKSFLARKNRKDSHDIKTKKINDDCPEYFKRNYHYQTDGYFTLDSAKRYDHQIELLFLGTAHIMRKVAYSVLKPFLKSNASVLEFGAGSGTSGHQFKLLFPDIELDLLDPSESYLAHAKSISPETFNEYIPAFIENFKSSKKYDCIYSCFVLHEIPVRHWDSMIQTLKDLLKENGHILIIDSQQNCDKIEHQFALDQFAEDFYEPYFQEFREKSLVEYFEGHGFKLIEKKEVLFSKSLLFSL